MSIYPSKQAAIDAYRHLLKIQRNVFSGDQKAIKAAKKETYSRFMQHKNETNVDILDQKLKLADQIANFLEQNSVKVVREEAESTPRLNIKGRKDNMRFDDVAWQMNK